jgi:hypothetical protein
MREQRGTCGDADVRELVAQQDRCRHYDQEQQAERREAPQHALCVAVAPRPAGGFQVVRVRQEVAVVRVAHQKLRGDHRCQDGGEAEPLARAAELLGEHGQGCGAGQEAIHTRPSGEPDQHRDPTQAQRGSGRERQRERGKRQQGYEARFEASGDAEGQRDRGCEREQHDETAVRDTVDGRTDHASQRRCEREREQHDHHGVERAEVQTESVLVETRQQLHRHEQQHPQRVRVALDLGCTCEPTRPFAFDQAARETGRDIHVVGDRAQLARGRGQMVGAEQAQAHRQPT